MGEGTAKFGREAVAKGVCSRVDVYSPVPPPIVVKTRTINANVQYIHIRRQAQRMLLCAQYVYTCLCAPPGGRSRGVCVLHTLPPLTPLCVRLTLSTVICVLTSVCSLHSACAVATLRTAAVGLSAPE